MWPWTAEQCSILAFMTFQSHLPVFAWESFWGWEGGMLPPKYILSSHVGLSYGIPSTHLPICVVTQAHRRHLCTRPFPPYQRNTDLHQETGQPAEGSLSHTTRS